LVLQGISLPLAYVISIFSGIWMAKHRGKTQDVAMGTTLLGLWSFPVILAAVLLIGYFANVNYFKWFPAGELHSPRSDEMLFLPSSRGPGYLLDTLWHMVLPIICLTYTNFAFISKLTRSSLLEALTQDYVRTARAKGLAERVVLFRHALRNSLLPLITVLAHVLPGLITGTIIIETVFSIPGMGQLEIEALLSQDRELFLSVSVMILLLQLVGFLVSDILYAMVDPRISYE
jgi:ABC-type dipeptide/oligopeptide/nickel transport system permease component